MLGHRGYHTTFNYGDNGPEFGFFQALSQGLP